jgi:hypothetical protein
MGWFLLLAVAVGLLLWWRASKRRQAVADLSLVFLDGYVSDDHLASDTWKYDFEQMAVESTWQQAGEPPEVTRSRLRRVDGPEWQLMLTEESYKAAIARVDAASGNNIFASTKEERYAQLLMEKEWHPAPSEHQGDVEQQYQLFMQAKAKA